MTRFALVLALSLPALSLAACGSDTAPPGNPDAAAGGPDGAPAADAAVAAERYLPLEVGNTWTYKVTPLGGQPVNKTNTVEAFEDAGGMHAGVMAYRVRTDKVGGTTIGWQQDTGNSVVRLREDDYDTTMTLQTSTDYEPNKLRIDESGAHLAVNAQFVQSFSESIHDAIANTNMTVAKNETWTVIATDEQLTVPAGTFTCLHLKRTGTNTGGVAVTKEFWFAKGVGKIKELDTSAGTEELASYTLAP
jgi:hypothetical protein